MAAKSFLKIAFTPEQPFMLEPVFISEILSRGWDMVHLRHPSASCEEIREILEAVPKKFHNRIRLHDHFELANSFNLGGIHLNRRCPSVPTGYSGPYSRSCHSVEEVKQCNDCDYVTLSPVFDSISKEGYKRVFTKIDFKKINKDSTSGVTTKVIALGGVDADHIRTVKFLGFNGFAVLGALMTASSLYELRLRLDRFEKETHTQTIHN